MIILFESGRLGNQLFQYAALRKLYPDEKLIFLGGEDLGNLLLDCEASFIERSRFPKWLPIGFLQRSFSSFAKMRLVNCIQEVRDGSGYSIQQNIGLMPRLYFLQTSYFQHRSIIEQITPRLRIRPALLSEARQWLRGQNLEDERHKLIFVHIRRGDYISWPSREYPAVLGARWYRRAMNEMREMMIEPRFLVMTDDVYYAQDLFEHEQDVHISYNTPFVDLALMSLCDHGILSASSFAWWGGWFSRQRNDERSDGRFLAPRYWAGHRAMAWYPDGFESDWIRYIE
ncbi:alpha-1,2-fucosyltransferase [Thioalkalivibrio denitrificans]|nr:alpha-1,2-fucosyltransferase [Thioalkalivibrio denitrificans]